RCWGRLRRVARKVRGVAVSADPAIGTGTSQFAVIQALAPSLRVEVSPVGVREPSDIEQAVTAFARSPNGGLIATAGSATARHRDLIIALAARHKLPAIYFEPNLLSAGRFTSYGPDHVHAYPKW